MSTAEEIKNLNMQLAPMGLRAGAFRIAERILSIESSKDGQHLMVPLRVEAEFLRSSKRSGDLGILSGNGTPRLCALRKVVSESSAREDG